MEREDDDEFTDGQNVKKVSLEQRDWGLVNINLRRLSGGSERPPVPFATC